MTNTEIETLINLATETMKTCRSIIDSFKPTQVQPRLVGIRQASIITSRSSSWLRKKLERGELTGYQTGRGGNWQVDPEVLVKELTAQLNQPKQPRKRKLAL